MSRNEHCQRSMKEPVSRLLAVPTAGVTSLAPTGPEPSLSPSFPSLIYYCGTERPWQGRALSFRTPCSCGCSGGAFSSISWRGGGDRKEMHRPDETCHSVAATERATASDFAVVSQTSVPVTDALSLSLQLPNQNLIINMLLLLLFLFLFFFFS